MSNPVVEQVAPQVLAEVARLRKELESANTAVASWTWTRRGLTMTEVMRDRARAAQALYAYCREHGIHSQAQDGSGGEPPTERHAAESEHCA